jgi:pimeloyl-ACP methyl ester carboxylesterase
VNVAEPGPVRRPPAAGAAVVAVAALAAAVSAAGEHPGRRVEIGAAALFVESEGSGPPLVLLPAGPGFDHAYFHPYFSSLAPARTVLYVDPRGCGRSSAAPPQGPPLDALVADLEGLRRALGYERFDLLGHGLGEAVALLYADRHPDRVGRLILLGAGLRAASFLDSPGLRSAAGGPVRDALRAAASDRDLSGDGRMREELRIVAPLLFHRLTDREFQRAFVDRIALSAGERETLRPALAPDGPAGDLSGPCARLKAPVLILAGRHDPTSTVEEAEALRRATPGARLVVLEESGAFPFAEQPVEFLKAVKEFLTGPAVGGAAGAGGGI